MPNNCDLIRRVVSYLNRKCDTNYKTKTSLTQKNINGRISEGYDWEDFKYVIDIKCEDWLEDEKMRSYLNPATLFRPSNFERYRNQKKKGVQGQTFRYFKWNGNEKVYEDENKEIYDMIDGLRSC